MFITTFAGVSGSADYHSADEVKSIIGKVERKLAEVKTAGAETYAPTEIQQIQDQMASARRLLEHGESDKAYYEIRIGVEYFPLIKARERLLKAKRAYDAFTGDAESSGREK
ncbi:MAG: DUF4398 domain-containing protein [Spirochaetes bacterium]|nr:DUF4398 domain-containing protein [Spirochaetota bacterium]